ncbi:MAG: discoidin domain-containing protein [Clostridia bacterium]|nr:discoidin domain-containing protein [Clostridia bacterium]
MRHKTLTKSLLLAAGIFLLFGIVLASTACAAYPVSGTDIPDGSVLLMGEIIGEQNGWDGSPQTGAAAAFDGHKSSYYDPTVKAADYAYCGIDAGAQYILTKVMILPRDSQPGRFFGASIQGSNDMVDWETLFVSSTGLGSQEWQEITDFDISAPFRYYRYWNGQEHGDVAEVEFYGRPSDGTYVGPVLLTGEVIGESAGWNGQRDKGAHAAFDGDRYTYYDPSAKSDDRAYCGIDLGQPFILSRVRILPREGWLDRYRGGSIQGSNDLEDWVTLFESPSAAASWDWQTITELDENTGYRYYRYWNGQEHGDVAELQFYGYPPDGDYTPPTPATLAVPVTEVTVRLDYGRDDLRVGVEPFKVTPGGTYPALPDLASDETPGFLGWYSLPSGGIPVKEGSAVTRLSDHTLYALWETDKNESAPAESPKTDVPAETPGENETDNPPSADETETAETEGSVEEDGGLNPVPIVCIAVSALAFIFALIVMAKSKD